MNHAKDISFLDTHQGNVYAEIAQEYLDRLLKGERKAAGKLILDLAEKNKLNIKDIYLKIFQPVLYEIGRLWQLNRISVAQEHYCSASTQMIMSQLYTYIFTGERKELRMVATCVGGELHEIGVRMVADFFEMEGWDTFYLGANMPENHVIKEILNRKAQLVGISATMTYHIDRVRLLINAIRHDDNCKNTRIMVGGYPFLLKEDLWQKLSADAMAKNADEAVEVASKIILSK